jgi:hypothetical protein
MSTRADIIRKAYQCIDEVYPESSTQDITSFGIDTFLDQAAKLIVKVVPVRALGEGQDIRDLSGVRLISFKDGVGCIQLPDNFIRLVSFSVSDWEHTVTEALDESSPRYIQQYNSTLRGTPCRPVVFLTQGGTCLEFYSTNLDQFSMSGDLDKAHCIAFDSVDDKYPSKLADITAWKTAELVLSAMNDVQAAQLCQAKTQEILQTL